MATYVSAAQKRVIDQMLSLLETGKIPSESSYGTATVLKDGAGISYGKHQSTDKSGTLDAIILAYADLKGKYGTELAAYLPQLAKNETAAFRSNTGLPPWMQNLLQLLKTAGSDPLMWQAQDVVFDSLYWAPAVALAESAGLKLPLSYAIVYDTCIHSGPGAVAKMRQLFTEMPPARGGDERAWTRAYLKARRNWLANFTSSDSEKEKLVRSTTYRQDAYQKVLDAGNWDLTTPLVFRNVTLK